MVRLHGESQSAQAVRTARAKGSVRRIGRHRPDTFETVDRVVDLSGDSGPVLGIVGIRL